MITFQQIKEICTAICTAYGITETDGKKITKELSQNQLSAILAGDLSGVPSVAARLGITCDIIQATPTDGHQVKQPDGTTAATDHTPTGETVQPDHGTEKRPKKNKPIECTPVTAPVVAPVNVSEPVDILEHVAAEIVEDDHDTLPASIQCDIEGWLADFASKYNLDLEKCAGLQWRAACLYVGQRLKASGILLDRALQKKIGGTPYNPKRMERLLYIWETFTNTYKHVPLASDFIAFTGASREWFYNTTGKSTAGQLDIAKKARQIEESALASALCDSRENPTGRIYYTKARLGWQETTTIQHVSATAAAPTVAALPVFETPAQALEN